MYFNVNMKKSISYTHLFTYINPNPPGVKFKLIIWQDDFFGDLFHDIYKEWDGGCNVEIDIIIGVNGISWMENMNVWNRYGNK